MREALLFCFNLKKSAAESNTCGLWRQCFIGNNMQRLVSPVQWRQFWPEWQEAWKSAQEGWGLSIAGSFGWGRYPIAKNACRTIGCFSSSHFYAVTWHGEGSKDRKMGGMDWTIGDADGATPKHMPNSACQTKKKVIPASDDRRWKMDLFSES